MTINENLVLVDSTNSNYHSSSQKWEHKVHCDVDLQWLTRLGQVNLVSKRQVNLVSKRQEI